MYQHYKETMAFPTAAQAAEGKCYLRPQPSSFCREEEKVWIALLSEQAGRWENRSQRFPAPDDHAC